MREIGSVTTIGQSSTQGTRPATLPLVQCGLWLVTLQANNQGLKQTYRARLQTASGRLSDRHERPSRAFTHRCITHEALWTLSPEDREISLMPSSPIKIVRRLRIQRQSQRYCVPQLPARPSTAAPCLKGVLLRLLLATLTSSMRHFVLITRRFTSRLRANDDLDVRARDALDVGVARS